MARHLKPQAESVYGTPQGLTKQSLSPVVAQRAPLSSDIGFDLGQSWIDEPASSAYILTNVSAGAATWVLATSAVSNVDTINGLAPVANDILIAGGTNLTDVNAGHTVTLNLDPAITLATSVTSPVYTSVAGLAINAPAGNNITIKMGDVAGADKVSFIDSATVEVAKIDSNGVLTAFDLEGTIGTVTPTTATFTTATATTSFVSPSYTAGAGTDTEIDAVLGQDIILKMGDAAGANKVSFVDSASAEVFSIDSNGSVGALAGLTVTGAFAQTAGTFNVGQDNAANAINIGGGTTARAIGIGNSAAAHVVTVGSVNTTAQTIVESGSVGLSLNATGAASPLTLDSVGVLELNSSAGVIGIGNDAVAQNINVGTGAAARTITVGNATLGSSTVINVGTGNLDLGVTATGHQTRLGSTNTTSQTTVQSGSTGIVINASGAASPLDIDSVGQLQINSSASTIDIGNDVVAQNVTLGTAGVRTVTVGSVTGASHTIIQSGTGDITVTGTVKELTADFTNVSGDELTFTASPLLQSSLDTGIAPTGATGDVNLMSLQKGIVMEQFIIGAGQTIIAPRMNASGLLVSLDLTVGEGAEYNFGASRLNSPHAFTVGTSDPFFFELEFQIDTMTGAAPYVFGFRKVEANNATFGNYTDYATIGMIATSSVANIVLATELNSGGQTVTDTTDLWGGDGVVNKLQVLVDGAGAVTYKINGVAPSVTAAFSFDAGDVVVPFIRITHSATPDTVELVSMKVGFQP